MGLPHDIISLVREWLTTWYFYESIEEDNSSIHCWEVGTVQGFILDPLLYALFVSPIFNLTKFTLFADDKYVLLWKKHLTTLLKDMKAKNELIIKWLKQFGLKVNQGKQSCAYFLERIPGR